MTVPISCFSSNAPLSSEPPAAWAQGPRAGVVGKWAPWDREEGDGHEGFLPARRKPQLTMADVSSLTIRLVLKHLLNFYFRNFSSRPVANPLPCEVLGTLSVKLRRPQSRPARVHSYLGPAVLILPCHATPAPGTEETWAGTFFPGGPALHLGLPGAPGGLLCG